MERMEEQHRAHDEKVQQLRDYADKVEADTVIRIQRTVEEDSLKYRQLKDEELSRQTIKYESMLDLLRKKVQQMKQGRIEEGAAGSQLQQLQDELDDEKEAHEKLKLEFSE